MNDVAASLGEVGLAARRIETEVIVIGGGIAGLTAALALVLSPLPLAAQAPIEPEGTRREYFTPGLVVETGARRGACDVLRFTDDGAHR